MINKIFKWNSKIHTSFESPNGSHRSMEMDNMAFDKRDEEKSANNVNKKVLLKDDMDVTVITPNDESDDKTQPVIEDEQTLVLNVIEKLRPKDFSSEVRAQMDVKQFLEDSVIILQPENHSLEGIVEELLEKMFKTDNIFCDRQDSEGQNGELNDNASPREDISECELHSKVEGAKQAIFVEFGTETYRHLKIAKSISSISINENEGLLIEQSWICAICSLATLNRRHVGIARLRNPINLDRANESIHFVILVITPKKEKGTKKDIEVSRTFSTMFIDRNFRDDLMNATDEASFIEILENRAKELTEGIRNRKMSLSNMEVMAESFAYERKWPICNGLRRDLKERIRVYPSDYKDGVRGKNAIRKVLSATTFIFFVCLLPSIAFGTLNDKNTKGKLNVQTVILSQTFGGLFFALFSGQPLVILLTTAPLAIYTQVIFKISDDFDLNFLAMFGWVGVFNAMFLVIYSVLDLSRFMKWSTRSTEETFAFFISVAFFYDAGKDLSKVFSRHYHFHGCNSSTIYNSSDTESGEILAECSREASLLFFLLLIGTVWLSVTLFNITKTPFLNSSKRELVADFALPVAVLIVSFVGSFCFRRITLDSFNLKDVYAIRLNPVPFMSLQWQGILGALGLAFPLSLLFFMDQNISGAMVNSPQNKLKKPSAYNWDILVVAVINAILSVFGLPWIHGALPHSPLHVKALAEMEERVDSNNHITYTVVRVHETRLSAILAHILIGISLFLMPIPIKFIPTAVLDGLFIYMAITALYGNQLWERLLLLITEQSAYPPSHYICRVPQRQVHIFTILQLVQLGLLCATGFAPTPYAKMAFPILLILMLPIRHCVLPKIINNKYLEALDKPI